MTEYERENIVATPSDNGYNSLSLFDTDFNPPESNDSSISEIYDESYLIAENKNLHIQLNTFKCDLQIKNASIEFLKQTITQQNQEIHHKLNSKVKSQILYNIRPKKLLKTRLKLILRQCKSYKAQNRELILKLQTMKQVLLDKDLILKALNNSFGGLKSEYVDLSAKHLILGRELIEAESRVKLLELRLEADNLEKRVVNELVDGIKNDLGIIFSRERNWELSSVESSDIGENKWDNEVNQFQKITEFSSESDGGHSSDRKSVLTSNTKKPQINLTSTPEKSSTLSFQHQWNHITTSEKIDGKSKNNSEFPLFSFNKNDQSENTLKNCDSTFKNCHTEINTLLPENPDNNSHSIQESQENLNLTKKLSSISVSNLFESISDVYSKNSELLDEILTKVGQKSPNEIKNHMKDNSVNLSHSKESFNSMDKKLDELSELCQRKSLNKLVVITKNCDRIETSTQTDGSLEYSSRLILRRHVETKFKKQIYKNIIQNLLKLNNKYKKEEVLLREKLDCLENLKRKYEKRFQDLFKFLSNLVQQNQGHGFMVQKMKFNLKEFDIYSFEDILTNLLEIILSKVSNIRNYVKILHMEINSMKDQKQSQQKYNKQLKTALDNSIGCNKSLAFQFKVELHKREILMHSIKKILEVEFNSSQINKILQVQSETIQDTKILIDTLIDSIKQTQSILRIKCCQ